MSREAVVVPAAEPRSYYGRPVLKQPVWTWEVPCYFFAGGLSGASAGLAYLAERQGRQALARSAWTTSAVAITLSPPLLISDLGRPERFLKMFRVFKPTSPLSVGSWLLGAFGPATTIAAVHARTGRLERLARHARPAAALLGLPLSTYTAALLSNTAVPAWHEARYALPFVFAGSAAASAGAAAAITTPAEDAGPARRLTMLGAALEAGASALMLRRLGELGAPYRSGVTGRLNHAADALGAGGALLMAGLGRRRAPAAAGGSLVLAGSLLKRWAVIRVGAASAAEPSHTVGPQRRRVQARPSG